MSDEILAVPADWSAPRLDEIVPSDAPIVYGIIQPGPEDPGGIPYVRPTEMDESGIKLDQLRKCSRTVADKYARASLERDDVVLAIVGTIGKVAIVPPELAGGNITQSAVRIRPPSDVSAKYLAYALRSPQLRTQYGEAEFGNAVRRLNVADVRKLRVPLAPKSQRVEIERTLDVANERSRRAKSALDDVPALLDRLRQSILAAAFRGDLTADWREANPDVEPASELLQRIRAERRRRWEEAELAKMVAKGKPPKDDRWKSRYVEPQAVDESVMPMLPAGWCWARWAELSDWITYGFTRPMPHVDSGPRIVTARHVLDGRVDFASAECTTESAFFGLSEKDRPRAGDILITKDGTIGRVAVVPDDAPVFCINQSVSVVWLRSCPLNRAYLAYAVASPMTQQRIADVARGMAVQHLSITDFGQMALPLAPDAETHVIAARTRAALLTIERLAATLGSASAELRRLDSAILAAAFRGELLRDADTDAHAAE